MDGNCALSLISLQGVININLSCVICVSSLPKWLLPSVEFDTMLQSIIFVMPFVD
jgi:hypothetical protein